MQRLYIPINARAWHAYVAKEREGEGREFSRSYAIVVLFVVSRVRRNSRVYTRYTLHTRASVATWAKTRKEEDEIPRSCTDMRDTATRGARAFLFGMFIIVDERYLDRACVPINIQIFRIPE